MSAVIPGQMALILVSALPVLMSLYPVPVLIPAQSQNLPVPAWQNLFPDYQFLYRQQDSADSGIEAVCHFPVCFCYQAAFRHSL